MSWPRYDTLTVSINPSGGPGSWRVDTDNAVRQLSDATGERFRSVAAPGANITIAWASTLMAPGPVAADKAGLTRVSFRSSALRSTVASAAVQTLTRLAGGTGPNGELPVLLHELGHAVGLGHYSGPEVMNPVDQAYARYQTGDLAGLTKLYRSDTCS